MQITPDDRLWKPKFYWGFVGFWQYEAEILG